MLAGGRRLLVLQEVECRRFAVGGRMCRGFRRRLWCCELTDGVVIDVVIMLQLTGLALSEDSQQNYTDNCG
jgi:hypothetical protein